MIEVHPDEPGEAGEISVDVLKEVAQEEGRGLPFEFVLNLSPPA